MAEPTPMKIPVLTEIIELRRSAAASPDTELLIAELQSSATSSRATAPKAARNAA